MSKIKLLVEIDEDEYKIRKEMAKDGFDSAVTQMIVNGTPYNPTGDCISREALKEEVRKHAEYYADRTKEDRYNVGYTECACEILDFIDNAPTVETFTLEDMQNNYDAGVDSVIGKYDKAKGEWAEFEGGYRCSNCDDIEVYTPNFCPNCGADMRGSENE